MANWYIGSVGYTAVAQWAAAHVYAAGAIVRQLAAPNVGSERCFRTSAGGVSGGSEPTWNLARGSSQPTDNTITDWVEVTGNETYQSPGNWAAPYARLLTGMRGIWVSGATVNNGGTTGTYAVNDVLTAALGTGTLYGDNATFKVTSASGGKVTGVSIISGGSYSASPSPTTANPVTGGGGSGCTLNLTTASFSLTDVFYLASNHAETQSTALNIPSLISGGGTNQQNLTICVDETASGHVPPTGADLKTTALISTTGASNLTASSWGYAYGITLSAGSGANAAILTINGTGLFTLDNCKLVKGSTTAGQSIFGLNASGRIILNNTTWQAGAAGDTVAAQSGSVTWRNTANAIAGATLPTTLFGGGGAEFVIDGVDLSALGSGKTLVSGGQTASASITFVNSKIGASVTVAGAFTPSSAPRVNLINCDSGGTNYRTERYEFEGTQSVETVVVRTGGASDGTTPISWKIVNTANVAWWHPFQSFQIAEFNTVTGTNRVVTLYGIWNAAALPNNDDIWIEAQYFGSASSPQASFQSDTKANILATNAPLTADSTSNWTSLVAARQNSHAYVLGNTIVPTGNSGRVFFCTTGGTSAGSEPGGYTTATDGSTPVTDGTAAFRAGVRFVLNVTLNSPQPALAGPIYVTVNAAKVSSTFWVDPLINLS